MFTVPLLCVKKQIPICALVHFCLGENESVTACEVENAFEGKEQSVFHRVLSYFMKKGHGKELKITLLSVLSRQLILTKGEMGFFFFNLRNKSQRLLVCSPGKHTWP